INVFEIVDLLQAYGVKAIYPLSINGNRLLEVHGQRFYLTEWFDGLPLGVDDVTEHHCQTIGRQLSIIHNIDVRGSQTVSVPFNIDLDHYVKHCSEVSPVLSEILNETAELIRKIIDRRNKAVRKLLSVQTLCLNDHGMKNVLWSKDDLRIINTDPISYGNPYQELLSCALHWAGADYLNFRQELFQAFISSYFSSSRLDSDVDWKDIYDSNTKHLSCLDRCLKEIIKEDINEKEKETAVLKANGAINMIIYFDKIRNSVLCSDIFAR
ncbi:MAG: phosphotransferase, partial [Erysipelotrichaceae bacterium]|nr:phosphotransferase [Erysipelotrichaceae bacterium]